MGTIIGAVASLLIGGVVATVTVVGLVSGSVNSTSDDPGDVTAPTESIDYGTTT